MTAAPELFCSITAPPSAIRTIDDVDLHGAWSDGAELTFADGTPAPLSLRTTVRVSWHRAALYVLFEAVIRSVRCAPASVTIDPVSGKTMRLWESSDVLECFIGPAARSQRRYAEFQVAPDGRWIDIHVDRRTNPVAGDHAWVSGARFRSDLNQSLGRWRAVMELPWTAIGSTPAAGLLLDVNFYRATGRFHGDELLAWSPTGYGPNCFHRVESFGRMVLGRR